MIESEFKDNVLVSCDDASLWNEYFDLIIRSVSATKNFEEIDNSLKINVHLIDNGQIKKLNSQFLNKNYETDVLSFNFYEGWKIGKYIKEAPFFPGEDSINEIGEIYLSVPKITDQAKENGVSFSKELSTMAIHGALHLLGYNHEGILEEKIMFSKTDEILKKVFLK